MAKCIGCLAETDTHLAVQGPPEWLLAALMVICQCSQEEAEAVIEVSKPKTNPSGSVSRTLIRPLPEQPVDWRTLRLLCCASCAAHGHFEVTSGNGMPCYRAPHLPEESN